MSSPSSTKQTTSESPESARAKTGRASRIASALLFAAVGALSFVLLERKAPEQKGPVREIAPADASAWLTHALRRESLPVAGISGTVRDEAQEPIAGARVCASCAVCELSEQPERPCVSTGADGSYSLSAPGAWALVIAVSAEGFLSSEANGGLPISGFGEARRGVDVTLKRGGAKLTGSVVDALGGPIPEARVQLVRFDSNGKRALLEAPADEDGRFAFWTTPGRVTLRAEASGYAPATLERVAPNQDVELALAPASQIRGRVVEVGSEKPVAGVEVRAMPAQSLPRAAPAVSDAKGEFVLTALDPGMYALSAEADRWRGGAAHAVAVGLADVVENVRVEVAPAVSILGHLIDAKDKSPCPRGTAGLGPPSLAASVLTKAELPEALVGSEENLVPIVRGYVEPDGTVRFKGVPPGKYQAIVQCEGHVLEDGPEFLDVFGRDLEITWKVTRAPRLTIHVTNGAGAAVVDASVFVTTSREGRRAQNSISSLRSDQSGTAVLSTGVYPGTYKIEAQDLAAEPVTVVVRPGDREVEATLKVRGSGQVLVHVRDEAGTPVEGLRVVAKKNGQPPPDPLGLGYPTATELGQGEYRLGPLEAGQYTVEVEDNENPPLSAQGPRGTTFDVTDATTLSARLTIARGAQLEGVVLDDKGQPQANVWVSASQRGGSLQSFKHHLRPPKRVLTDTEGGFRLDGLVATARYTVDVSEPLGARTKQEDVAPGTPLRIVLPAVASLAGSVVDAQGKPASRFDVQARHEATGALRPGELLQGGQFRIRGVPAGKVTILASTSNAHASQEVDVQPGQRLDGVRLVFRPPAPLAPEQAAQENAPGPSVGAAPPSAPGRAVEPADTRASGG